MKAASDCHHCLRRLVHQTAELATTDPELRAKAIDAGLRIVEENFSPQTIPLVIATEVYDALKEITQNPDPYRGMKDEEIKTSRRLLAGMSPAQGLDGLLKLAVLGNTLDFFREPDTIDREMGREVRFAIDDGDRFEEKLSLAAKVLYLADNAGEVLFDLPLIRWMERLVRVIYVVKEGPAGDDLTLDDLERSGLGGELRAVMTTGTATPGVILSLASDEFLMEFDSADLILAKGMAYYEALSELPRDGRIFFLLRAKCQPVADSLRVPLNSYVAMLW